jgi:predicted deacylase
MDMLNKTQVHGSITFIPLANPYATNNKHGTYTYGRYNPVTGDNWNRNYRDIIKDAEFNIEEFAQENKDLAWNDIKDKFKEKLEKTLS